MGEGSPTHASQTQTISSQQTFNVTHWFYSSHWLYWSYWGWRDGGRWCMQPSRVCSPAAEVTGKNSAAGAGITRSCRKPGGNHYASVAPVVLFGTLEVSGADLCVMKYYVSTWQRMKWITNSFITSSPSSVGVLRSVEASDALVTTTTHNQEFTQFAKKFRCSSLTIF